jgi:hypothetical protein
MSPQPLAPEVQALIATLDSADQLEVLLHIARAPSQVHEVRVVAEALTLTHAAVDAAFRDLQTKRLVQAIHVDNAPMGYQYAPATIALHAAVEELALAYATHPVVIIKALWEKPNFALRSFADAFRVRRRSDS